MEAKHWGRVEELFHATLQLEAADRAEYLKRECLGNDVLRQDVESLVAASENEHPFIETPVLTFGMIVLSHDATESLVGQSISHYKIIRLLGEGGMGRVYLAEDCMLERQVALKFLANGLGDEDQLMREAIVVAKLENSNICTVHGVEKIGDDSFIVMQYAEGETLASLLLRETLSLDQALDFAEQTVGALAAAHLQGIIHRDIKPQNMVVTPEGRIKVLDFGLAKFTQQNRGISQHGAGIDQTAQVGIVMGTVPYMSPEQIRGEELDGRSDIFSFGIVFYEMLGGGHPFMRKTNEKILLAIQEDEPAPLRGVPESLVSIVRRCLAKNRTDRFETTKDLLIAIRRVREKRRRTAAAYWQAVRRHRHFAKFAVASMALLICTLAAAAFVYYKLTEVHTLAVVPIVNLTGDSNLDYLSSGLTRNLYDKFSYLPRLKVKLPSEVPSNQLEDMVRVGQALNVEAVLSGEILKQGESLVLHARVVKTANGALLSEYTLSIDPSKMFALQDDVTRKVSSALGFWLIRKEKQLLTKRQTDNQEAWDAYARGRYYWSLKRDRQNIQKAIGYFDQAIDLDPAFAKAYTGRADCYVLMGNVLYGPLSTKEAMDKARYDASYALELDPSLPESHTSMGVIRFKFEWQWQQAEDEFKRAIELDPEYAPAHYEYANLLAVLKRFDESIKQSQAAKELDPYSRLAEMNYGRALYFARDYDAAARQLETSLAQNPGVTQLIYLKSLVLLQQRNYEEAIVVLEELHAKDPLFAAAPLGYAYGKSGRTADAQRILRELDQFSKEKPATELERAIVYLGIGSLDEAFALLEQAYKERFASLVYLTTDPLFDDLRGDPRFNDLARRMNLPL